VSIRKIEIGCDVPDCRAYCSVSASSLEAARQFAADCYGWTRRGDSDVCRPCGRGDTPDIRTDVRGTPK
jgi:hypothetical protein